MVLTTAPLAHSDHLPRTTPLAKSDDPHRISGEKVTLRKLELLRGDRCSFCDHAQYGNTEVPLENDVTNLKHSRLISTQNLLPPGFLDVVFAAVTEGAVGPRSGDGKRSGAAQSRTKGKRPRVAFIRRIKYKLSSK